MQARIGRMTPTPPTTIPATSPRSPAPGAAAPSSRIRRGAPTASDISPRRTALGQADPPGSSRRPWYALRRRCGGSCAGFDDGQWVPRAPGHSYCAISARAARKCRASAWPKASNPSCSESSTDRSAFTPSTACWYCCFALSPQPVRSQRQPEAGPASMIAKATAAWRELDMAAHRLRRWWARL